MKRILQFAFILCFAIEGYGQILSINDTTDPESSFGPEQLVEDVLISSTCTTVNNFSFQVNGTPTDTNTKSYGFFRRPPGSTFPFAEGVVLTSGSAFPAGNTVSATLVSADNGLVGDTDLETALGITDTNDATFIKFDFVPLVDEISFRFLMASEEYDGNYECQFSDSFAFLLREVGAPAYTNLAVLPDGITPVSVTNINDAPLCSANTAFFEGYNVGDTNYGGRTVALTATATVTPNVTYEIKLVVADQGVDDFVYDSAIFLEAGSFNIGGDLGDDYTVASGNPGCDGTAVTLDATIGVPGTTYKWFFNGGEIAGATGPTYDALVDGTYGVEATVPGGCNAVDEIEIEFTTPPVIDAPPENIVICETDGDLIEVFDFTTNEALVLGSQVAADFPISFHANQTDAETNQNPLTIPYSNTLQYETIWVRIADATQTCFEVASFNIEVQQVPTANVVAPYALCDDDLSGSDIDGIVTFDLSTRVAEVLGTQLLADFAVTFYNSQGAADAGLAGTDITTPIQNSSNPQTIYARIENRLNTDCYDTTSFDLVVNPRPVVTPLVTLRQCDNDTDGFTDFNLTEANSLISTDHLNETFTYYLTQAEAETGLVADQILNFINYPNPVALNSTVYTRIETVNGCYRTAQIDLVVGATQIPAGFNLTYNICDDKLVDGDNTNGIASFDFSDATAQVRALFPLGQNLTITYYTNEIDALAETNAIGDISDHRNEGSPNTQQIYVRVDSDDVNACLGLGAHITLIVNPLPRVNPLSDYTLCSDTNEATFDLTTRDIEVTAGQPRPVLISYHLSEQDAIDNIPIANATNFTSESRTVWVRAEFTDNGNGISDECVNTDMNFDLIVNLNPEIFSPDEIRICSDQVNTLYDLTIRADQITNGDSSITLTYFESMLDLTNNTPIVDPTQYTSTVLVRDIVVLATGTNLCTSTILLPLQTILYANIDQTPEALEECEIDNNGFDFFDLTRSELGILNGLDAADFTFTYYEEEVDAIAGNANNITNITNFENTQAVTQTIYVRVQPVANECYIVVPLRLIVNPVPEIDIEEKYVICLNSADQVINPVTQTFLPNPPIDTQLDAATYTFQWYAGTEAEVNLDPASVIIAGATEPRYYPTSEGYYTVIATNIATGCTIPATTEVVSSYPPESITVELVSTAFSGNNVIEVSVIGNGEYEFRVDYGPWQSGTRFENVTGGEHIVYVRDLLNCNEIWEVQMVIDYPRYFTPNGDGYHDRWNIKGIGAQANSKIYIFDRYGKLLKQLSPRGQGWDGTFNGNELPSSDYWFVVEYEEPSDGTRKQFKAHFTLKR